MKDKDYKAGIIVWLDWSSRHLKNLQKQYPPSVKHQIEAVEMFSVMKIHCHSLDINVLEWCKEIKVPYKRNSEPYHQLFIASEPYDISGKPMLRSGYYDDLISKMIGTGKNKQ